MMLDMMFQHLGTVQCALFLGLRSRLISCWPSSVCFGTETDGLLFPKVVSTI